MSLLETLSESSIILWVAESDYGYPFILTLHSIGMALVVGLLSMIDLRVLGVGRSIPVTGLSPFYKIVWFGLVLNVVSGALLFLANYAAFLSNTAFITKLTLLLAGGIGSLLLARKISGDASAMADSNGWQAGQTAKILAIFCLLMWIAAITAGRIVGYTSLPE